MRRLITPLVLLSLVSLAFANTAFSKETQADILLTNGKVYSLDWDEPGLDGTPAENAPVNNDQWQPDASSIAIKAAEILYVGDEDGTAIFTGDDTKIIDLAGATVIPGLVDSHVHVAELGEILYRVNLSEVTSPEQAIEKLQSYVQQQRDAGAYRETDWLIGQGWDEGAWANNYPNRQLLDKAFPDTPVYLRSLHGFAVWVNSRALEMAGIDKHSKAPVGGEIVRDDKGVPTGILLNRATTLIADKIPKPSIEKFASYVEAGMQQMARDGYVAVHEAGAESAHIAALQLLQEQQRLPVRMYAMLSARDTALAKAWVEAGPLSDPEGFLDIRSVKAYYDGALGSRGARLLADYSDQAGHRGVSGSGYGFDADIVDELIDAGFQVGIHAIGDAGNKEVLDFFAAAAKRTPESIALRHRIEHAQVIQASDFSRFSELALIASMEPPHAVEDKTWAEDRLGPERIKGAYAWRTLRQIGVPITFNSDLPGSDHNIFYGLHAAVTRRDKNLQPEQGWYTDQAVSMEEAIRGYTNWAAWAAFREQQTGILKPGYWADITVMDIDPFQLASEAPAELLNGKILMTVVNGKIVYRAE
ncbi:MAG: amidohydrolase [Pseudomonadota bacterium]